MGDRTPHFRNADRLNFMLAMVRADIDRASSVSAYSRLLRTAFSVVTGQANPDWDAIRNPKESESSMRFYAGPQAVASSTASSVLHGSRSPVVHDPKRVAAPGGDQARFRR